MTAIEIFGFTLLCWLGADFLSGVFHWMEDRYFEADWPIIGKHIASPNLEHHANPTGFLAAGYWERNWTTIVPALVVGGIVYAICPTPWVLIFVFVSQANEVHAMSHRRCSEFVRVLQDTELLISARHHGGHHRDAHDKRYCVMSGWLNPLLDWIGFWWTIEWLLFCLFGITAREEA